MLTALPFALCVLGSPEGLLCMITELFGTCTFTRKFSVGNAKICSVEPPAGFHCVGTSFQTPLQVLTTSLDSGHVLYKATAPEKF